MLQPPLWPWFIGKTAVFRTSVVAAGYAPPARRPRQKAWPRLSMKRAGCATSVGRFPGRRDGSDSDGGFNYAAVDDVTNNLSVYQLPQD
jgi:hypothetical protein